MFQLIMPSSSSKCLLLFVVGMLLLLESHPVVAGFVVARSLRQQLFKTSSSNTTALRKRPLSLRFDKSPLFSADNGTTEETNSDTTNDFDGFNPFLINF